MVRFSNLFAAVAVILTSITAAHATIADDAKSFRDITLTPRRIPANEERGDLREDAKEVAEVLGITDMVDRLRREKSNYATSREIQNIRLLCLWRIFTASEEVRQVCAECGFDRAQTHIALDELTAKKQMAIDLITTANFAQGGTLGIIKQSISYPRAIKNRQRIQKRRAQEIAITSFSTSIGLASINQLIGPRWFRKIDSRPNMLSHFFDENFRPKDFQVSYLWKFYNKSVPGFPDNLTRREVLVKHWRDFGGVDIQSQKLVQKVTANVTDVETENIRILNNRMTLLSDLQSHIEEFDSSLYELHKAITN